jgi:hypothetical protein
MQKYSIILSLSTFCLTGHAFGQEANGDTPEPSFITKMNSSQAEERRKAFEQALTTKRTIKLALLSRLDEVLKNPDRKYNGEFHMTLKALAEWRVEEAVDPLTAYLDFSLDPKSFPVGMLPTQAAYFPVATTLAEIGGPRVNENLFQRINSEADDRTLRICAWILQKNNGNEVAQILIQSRLNRLDLVLKNIGLTTTNTEKKNLERLLEILQTNSTNILFPLKS